MSVALASHPLLQGSWGPAVPWSVAAVPKPVAPTGRAGPSAELMGSFQICSLLGDVEVEDSVKGKAVLQMLFFTIRQCLNTL